MRISDWSSDVCSSDLHGVLGRPAAVGGVEVDDVAQQDAALDERLAPRQQGADGQRALADAADHLLAAGLDALGDGDLALARQQFHRAHRSEEHTSELQSLMRISYAVFCLKKKKK